MVEKLRTAADKFTDLVNQVEDEDREDRPFDIICPTCGSTKCEFENTMAFHESCAAGSIDLVCKGCGYRRTVYEPI